MGNPGDALSRLLACCKIAFVSADLKIRTKLLKTRDSEGHPIDELNASIICLINDLRRQPWKVCLIHT